MIPAAFDYHRPAELGEALALAGGEGAAGDSPVVMAGGQSLVPALRRRALRPSSVVDLAGLDELRLLGEAGTASSVGALCTYASLASDPLIRGAAAMLAHVAGRLGDPALRTMATLGGAAALAHPNSDMAVVLVALGAEVVLSAAGERGPTSRRVRAAELFVGPFRTCLRRGELIVGFEIPESPGRWSYRRFTGRAQGWPVVCAAVVETEGPPRVVLGGLGPVPLRAEQVEAALEGGGGPDAASRLVIEAAPGGDDAGFRRHVAASVLAGALAEVLGT